MPATNPETIAFTITECPLGLLLVGDSEQGICAVFMADTRDTLIAELGTRFVEAQFREASDGLQHLVQAIADLIVQPHTSITLALDIRGTAFQQKVWQTLREIPVGTTASYSDIAHKIGAPKAFRAVATACASNALALLIPCHRVVRSNGDLAGYRWGIERKRSLLTHEKNTRL